MDFIDLFDEFNSIYDLGMGADIRAFLTSRKDIAEYHIVLDDNQTIIISLKYLDTSLKDFIYDFIKFVAYDDFCIINKELKEENKIYHIYTAVNNQSIGTRIMLKVQM